MPSRLISLISHRKVNGSPSVALIGTMLPCLCSARALEIFVKDFAGISLRRVRPRAPFHQQRNFGTRPPFRQLETSISGPSDDPFIPFEIDRQREGLPFNTTGSSKGSESKSVASNLHQDGLEDEWHAEIEIASPRPQETVSGRTEHFNGNLNQQESSIDSDAEVHSADDSHSVDSISLQDLHHPETKGIDEAAVPLPPSDQAHTPQKSGAELRLDRKRRRIEAGKYNRTQTESRGEQTSTQDQVQTVLDKIQALEGPDVVSRKDFPEQQKEKPPSNKAEMKSKAKKKQPVMVEPDQSGLKIKKEDWQVQKQALEHKFGDNGWQPRKRLSPDTLEGIRALHHSDPSSYTTATLAGHFQVTPEAIRRILKSKWRPNVKEIEDRRQRWEKRGMRKWEDMAEQGIRPPAKWRAMGISHAESYQDGKPRAEKTRRRREDDGFVRWDDLARDARDDNISRSLAERIL